MVFNTGGAISVNIYFHVLHLAQTNKFGEMNKVVNSLTTAQLKSCPPNIADRILKELLNDATGGSASVSNQSLKSLRLFSEKFLPVLNKGAVEPVLKDITALVSKAYPLTDKKLLPLLKALDTITDALTPSLKSSISGAVKDKLVIATIDLVNKTIHAYDRADGVAADGHSSTSKPVLTKEIEGSTINAMKDIVQKFGWTPATASYAVGETIMGVQGAFGNGINFAGVKAIFETVPANLLAKSHYFQVERVFNAIEAIEDRILGTEKGFVPAQAHLYKTLMSDKVSFLGLLDTIMDKFVPLLDARDTTKYLLKYAESFENLLGLPSLQGKSASDYSIVFKTFVDNLSAKQVASIKEGVLEDLLHKLIEQSTQDFIAWPAVVGIEINQDAIDAMMESYHKPFLETLGTFINKFSATIDTDTIRPMLDQIIGGKEYVALETILDNVSQKTFDQLKSFINLMGQYDEPHIGSSAVYYDPCAVYYDPCGVYYGPKDIEIATNGSDTVNNKNATVIMAMDGNDIVYAGAKNNIVFGGTGNDKIYGQQGNDKLYGGDGSDIVDGGDGNDRINGGDGSDILYGGNGSDIFVFDNLQGGDTIKDFSLREGDKIDLSSILEGYYNPNLQQSIHDFVQVQTAIGLNGEVVSFLNVDLDGKGGNDPIGIAKLEGVGPLDIDAMIKSGSLIV